jgi:starvation-inducible DNA-binding protein
LLSNGQANNAQARSAGQPVCRRLCRRPGGLGSRTRKAINQTDELGDKVGADIGTEISRGIDNWRWFVEAHGQAPVQHGVRR